MGAALTPRTGIIALGIVLLACFASAALGPARSVAATAVGAGAPLYRVTLGVRRLVASVREIGQLRTRVAALEAENAQLRSERAVDTERSTEAALVATQSDAAVRAAPSLRSVVARTTARSPSGMLDAITLDQGSGAGIGLGDAVLVDGFFAGTITMVASDSSQALLATNPSLLVPVLVQGSRAQGLLRASLEGMIVSDVPSSADIKSGEVVLTNDLAGVVPQGLPIGTVDSVLSERSDILKRVRIVSPVPFHQLEFVAVVGRQDPAP